MCAGILKQSMGARNRVGIGLLESISLNRFLSSCFVLSLLYDFWSFWRSLEHDLYIKCDKNTKRRPRKHKSAWFLKKFLKILLNNWLGSSLVVHPLVNQRWLGAKLNHPQNQNARKILSHSQNRHCTMYMYCMKMGMNPLSVLCRPQVQKIGTRSLLANSVGPPA